MVFLGLLLKFQFSPCLLDLDFKKINRLINFENLRDFRKSGLFKKPGMFEDKLYLL